MTIVLLAMLSVVEALQVMIVVATVSHFIPIPWTEFAKDLFPVNQVGLRPEREMFFYHVFILTAMLIQGVGLWFLRRDLKNGTKNPFLIRLLLVDAAWLFLQLFAVFKILMYSGQLKWATSMFYLVLAMALLSRFFWVEINWLLLKLPVKSMRVRGFLSAPQAWVHAWVLRCWPDKESRRRIKFFLVLEGILAALLLSALFKMTVYCRWPQMATNAYHVLWVVLILHTIFHKQIFNCADAFYRFATQPSNLLFFFRVAGVVFIPFIFLLLYLPDPLGIVARVFIGEQFHNWDLCVMGPAFAYDHGLRLDVDVISRYGLGMPIVATYLMKCLGGVSYVHLVQMLMWMCMVYYAGWFLLLRRWLGGVLIPIAAILFAIRTQMFHDAAYPIVLTYPSATVLRFFGDIVFFFLLWRYLNTHKKHLLWLCSLCCGFMIFYMFAEGLYLTAAFYTFLILYATHRGTRHHLIQSQKDRWCLAGHVLLVPVTASVLIFLTQGKDLFNPLFWQNLAEYRNYFLSGYGVGPIYSSLIEGNYTQSLMGFIVPLVYVLTILVGAGLWYAGLGGKKYLLAIVLAVEGLGFYHYYTLLSIWTGYYMHGVPFNMLIAFWANEFLMRLYPIQRRKAALALVAICLWALLTNHKFISYPNLMNFSRNPLVDSTVVQFPIGRESYFNHLFREYPEYAKLSLNSLGERDEQLKIEKDFLTDEDLKAYYLKEIDFQKDVTLIKQWTAPGDEVPLIAGFEIEFLAQANRKPFFYYFPMLNSRPLRMRMLHVSSLDANSQLNKTINDLETRRPPYIFMERIYLNNTVPASYMHDTPGLIGLLAYVQENYTAVATGEYLVAMRRK